jgi:hypothetical protein
MNKIFFIEIEGDVEYIVWQVPLTKKAKYNNFSNKTEISVEGFQEKYKKDILGLYYRIHLDIARLNSIIPQIRIKYIQEEEF